MVPVPESIKLWTAGLGHLMNCPSCNSDQTKVIDTRPVRKGACVRRRRGCMACQIRWTTHEVDADQLAALEGLSARRPTRAQKPGP